MLHILILSHFEREFLGINFNEGIVSPPFKSTLSSKQNQKCLHSLCSKIKSCACRGGGDAFFSLFVLSAFVAPKAGRGPQVRES